MSYRDGLEQMDRDIAENRWWFQRKGDGHTLYLKKAIESC